ncbi:LacI family transcriptional regulator [Dictyobacter alpinus]|uniref:LacI family transcriptional regulator n=1 Tax=Dictyobacter alpinus TaxID=2014873 RepID=A0A402BI76_9CHLR|nr:LacI family DNA-binding transcriptional regulator [Dictyobacter alpinus]GCE31065.1 LacI family transcriptional regulator [Dictyobacter alpinus]
MANIYDVARLAGVSTGTVSRYLSGNGYVGEISRGRIQKAITELNFSPSRIARGLTKKHTQMIGLVVSDLLNPFIPELVRGAQDCADEAGHCTLIYNTDGKGAREVRALNLLYERRVDGLIITAPETVEGNQCILDLHKRGLPIVLIGRKLATEDIDYVTTDTYSGAIEAVMHLAQLGHRRIAFIEGDAAHDVASDQQRGYLDGLKQAELTYQEHLLVATTLTREGGAAAMIQLLHLPTPPTSVFAVNDIVAVGAMQEALRLGYRVPEQLSIVGFDDITLAANTLPAMTTVRQPKSLLGRTAVELLLDRIDQYEDGTGRELQLPCALIVRESTMHPLI